MADEKVLVVNLRKGTLGSPRWRRSAEAVSAIRKQVSRATRSGRVSVDSRLNSLVWARGMRSPPLKVRVKVSRQKDGSVRAEPA